MQLERCLLAVILFGTLLGETASEGACESQKVIHDIDWTKVIELDILIYLKPNKRSGKACF